MGRSRSGDAMAVSLKKLSDAVQNTRRVIALKPTPELKASLKKMRKFGDAATDRLEKASWTDLTNIIEEELKRRIK